MLLISYGKGWYTENGRKDYRMENKGKNNCEMEESRNKKIEEYGQVTLEDAESKSKIELVSIIGEVEGHECLEPKSKTTKYEHILPQLAKVEAASDIDGVLFLLNTVGGDVEAGLAIAEMIASLSKPTVSLVLGGSHSIGVPLAVAADYSFIVPTATMIIHPVRTSGTIIGVRRSFVYMEQIQNRILRFIEAHTSVTYDNLKKYMLDTSQLVQDVGSIIIGQEAVSMGLIDAVGGIKEAMEKIRCLQKERADD